MTKIINQIYFARRNSFDIIVAAPELIKEEDNIVELADIACDAPRKSKEHSDKALNFISNPKNKKSAKTHKRYQN